MSNKKNKPQAAVNNYIENLNLEIDYDKFADAIVKAQQKALELDREEKKQIQQKRSNLMFFKSVKYILFNKKDTNGALLNANMKFVLNAFFNAMFTISVAVCLLIVFSIFGAFKSMTWNGGVEDIAANIIIILILVFAFVMLFLVALLFRGSANDIENENDKNYITAVFSAMVSVVALVVSFVALYKGM